MTPTWRAAADVLAADVRTVFGDRLRSVVAYGAHVDGQAAGDDLVTCLVLVTSLTMDDLDFCARRSPGWHKRGLATPLILPEQEFRGSLDAFPLEYAEIVRAHAEVAGHDPFDGLAIDPADLRRACETQIKSHLLHLREDFIETAGHPRAVAELVRTSAPAFASLLRNVARLHGVTTSDRQAATREGARVAGMPDGVMADMLALEQRAAVSSADPARLYPAYLAAVEQLARFIDTWR